MVSTRSTEATRERTRRIFEEIWNGKQRDRIDEYFAPDATFHGFGGDEGGLDAYRAWFDLVTEAFPDIEFEVDHVFGEDDLVTAVWRATATHEGPFMGVERTGESASIAGITVSRVEDDRTVESWMN